MKDPTDITPIIYNCLIDKVDCGAPGTSNIFDSVKLAIAEFVQYDTSKDLAFYRKTRDCHNDTNRLPTAGAFCLENKPSLW